VPSVTKEKSVEVNLYVNSRKQMAALAMLIALAGSMLFYRIAGRSTAGLARNPGVFEVG
jgi:hypothetical protein